MRAARRLLGILLAAALVPAAGAVVAASTVTTENLTARLIPERAQVAPGDSVALALVFDIRPGWHTYWRNPGDSGEPPRIQWRLPDGVEAGPIRWPAPTSIRVGPLANYGYSGRATHLIEIRTPAEWPAGEPLPIAADATWLVCEEECIPEQGSFALTLDTAGAPGSADPEAAGLFADARAALPAGSIPARLQRTDSALRLAVPAQALPEPVQTAQFFAGEWGLIEHAAPQPLTREGEDYVLTLTPGAAAASAAPAGLLVVEGPDGRRSFELDAAAPAPATPVAAVTESGADLGLPLALLFALLGGMILNLMPCVFPVLAIKAIGLARQGGAPFRERALHALAYTGGVVTFFALVALLLLGLRAGGSAVGWGFQLQSPPFVALMAYVFLVLGLSLSGAVTLGTRLMGVGSAAADAGGQAGAFATGALAALVAAPCTAPLMGAALGYALTLPWLLALAIVLALGVGMALPLVLLSLLPRLAERLPRPGPWMERLKQLLAFPMYATAAWLVWVLSVQTGPDGVAAVLAGMVLIALALWLREYARIGKGLWRKAAIGSGAAGAVSAVLLGIGLERSTLAPAAQAQLADGPERRPYAADLLADARSAGRPVFVNMTAAWCITCLVNERVALDRADVRRAFAERDVLYLKGDWTNRDPAITAFLEGFGRSGVPIYVLYPPGGEPAVLPQVLTESIVLQALDAVEAPAGLAEGETGSGRPPASS